MVWGCTTNGVENLVIILGTKDKFVYLNTLKRNLKESTEKLRFADEFSLYQDNDSKDSARVMQERLLILQEFLKHQS